ncbi:phasin family protein [Hansschlegelia sp.]|uniref:phasin family protein n=1 Tax=Hansschlegelia sp. TaxID=2041892 RepID=UPI002BC49439|nr:phasin family protein [Hansschlegelia sp.]HVI27411.1 phasin family protein [Hansschlegelia sp.]
MAGAHTNSQKQPNGAADLFMPSFATGAWRSAMTLPALSFVEALRFASRRLEAQADFMTELLGCKTPAEALEKQSDFLSQTAKAYGTEAETITRKLRDGVAHEAAA